jgi:hypothetical protein
LAGVLTSQNKKQNRLFHSSFLTPWLVSSPVKIKSKIDYFILPFLTPWLVSSPVKIKSKLSYFTLPFNSFAGVLTSQNKKRIELFHYSFFCQYFNLKTLIHYI